MERHHNIMFSVYDIKLYFLAAVMGRCSNPRLSSSWTSNLFNFLICNFISALFSQNSETLYVYV